MTTRKRTDPEPEAEPAPAPEEVVATPLPITSPDKPPPPPLPVGDGAGVVLSASGGLGYFHHVVQTRDVDALIAIASAAHDVVQAGGLSTTDRRIARLHADLTTALYNA